MLGDAASRKNVTSAAEPLMTEDVHQRERDRCLFNRQEVGDAPTGRAQGEVSLGMRTAELGGIAVTVAQRGELRGCLRGSILFRQRPASPWSRSGERICAGSRFCSRSRRVCRAAKANRAVPAAGAPARAHIGGGVSRGAAPERARPDGRFERARAGPASPDAGGCPPGRGVPARPPSPRWTVPGGSPPSTTGRPPSSPRPARRPGRRWSP